MKFKKSYYIILILITTLSLFVIHPNSKFIFGLYSYSKNIISDNEIEINNSTLKTQYDFYTYFFENTKNEFKSERYIEFDYESIFYLDKNFTLITSKNFLEPNSEINIWDAKLDNSNLLWIGFERFKNLYSHNKKFGIVPSTNIMIMNLSNLSTYKLIKLNKTRHPNSFCFDKNFTYFTTFENGFEFGVGKVNRLNHSQINEKLYTNYSDVSQPLLKCPNNKAYIMTENIIFELNKSNLNLKKILNINNLRLTQFEILNNTIYFLGINETKYKINFFSYNLLTNDFKLIENFPNDLEDFAVDEKNKNIFYLTNSQKLFVYNISNQKIIKTINFNHYEIKVKNNYLIGGREVINLDNFESTFNNDFRFYTPQSLIYTGNFSK